MVTNHSYIFILFIFIGFVLTLVLFRKTMVSPFEIFYGFNHLTPLDLLPWPIDKMVSFDDKKHM
jgi:hypothetical protein